MLITPNTIIDQRGFAIGERPHESIEAQPVSRFAEAGQTQEELRRQYEAEQEEERRQNERWDMCE